MKQTEKEQQLYKEYCISRMNTKNEAFDKKYGLADGVESFDTTDDSKLIIKAGGRVLEFQAVFVGSYNTRAESFLWAWANGSLTDQQRARAFLMKELLSTYGDEFNESKFTADEETVEAVNAVVLERLDAMTMTALNFGELDFYLAIKSEIKK